MKKCYIKEVTSLKFWTTSTSLLLKIRGILIFIANPLIHMDIQNIINKGKVSSKTENISFPLWKIYPKEGWIIFVWQWETWEHGWVNGLTIKKQKYGA